MVFTPNARVPNLPFDPPGSVSVADFILREEYYVSDGIERSSVALTDGLTGKAFTTADLDLRIENLAKSLAKHLNWRPNVGSQWEKVVGFFGLNTVDYMTASWATHRLGGISLLLHATNSVTELVQQLGEVECDVVFTCLPLLAKCLQAAKELNIPDSRIFLLDLPASYCGGAVNPVGFRTSNDLATTGSEMAELEALSWPAEQVALRIAYLCATSGTSGLQKLLKIPHRSLVANMMQSVMAEVPDRKSSDVALGILPFSHSFALLICHAAVYRGDNMVILPAFDMKLMLGAVQSFAINRLYVVPPIVAGLAAFPQLLEVFDVSSVQQIVVGAAALKKQIAERLVQLKPTWQILLGYGLTETATGISVTSTADVWLGSCGSLLPACEARLIAEDGTEVDELGKAGELFLKSPSIAAGYLHNEKANARTFLPNGWLRTGDLAMFRKSPAGIEHMFIVDRIKDMIKVKGIQVVPADIEAQLLQCPGVKEAAVIGIENDLAGELPGAFIVPLRPSLSGDELKALKESAQDHVKDMMEEHNWLKGGAFLVDEIPKSHSGKVLKKDLKAALQTRSKQAA